MTTDATQTLYQHSSLGYGRMEARDTMVLMESKLGDMDAIP